MRFRYGSIPGVHSFGRSASSARGWRAQSRYWSSSPGDSKSPSQPPDQELAVNWKRWAEGPATRAGGAARIGPDAGAIRLRATARRQGRPTSSRGRVARSSGSDASAATDHAQRAATATEVVPRTEHFFLRRRGRAGVGAAARLTLRHAARAVLLLGHGGAAHGADGGRGRPRRRGDRPGPDVRGDGARGPASRRRATLRRRAPRDVEHRPRGRRRRHHAAHQGHHPGAHGRRRVRHGQPPRARATARPVPHRGRGSRPRLAVARPPPRNRRTHGVLQLRQPEDHHDRRGRRDPDGGRRARAPGAHRP